MKIKGPLKIVIQRIDEQIEEAYEMQRYHNHRINQIRMSDIPHRQKKQLLKDQYDRFNYYNLLIRDLSDQKAKIAYG